MNNELSKRSRCMSWHGSNVIIGKSILWPGAHVVSRLKTDYVSWIQTNSKIIERDWSEEALAELPWYAMFTVEKVPFNFPLTINDFNEIERIPIYYWWSVITIATAWLIVGEFILKKSLCVWKVFKGRIFYDISQLKSTNFETIFLLKMFTYSKARNNIRFQPKKKKKH